MYGACKGRYQFTVRCSAYVIIKRMDEKQLLLFNRDGVNVDLVSKFWIVNL